MMGRSLWPVWTRSTERNRTAGALSQTQGSWALRAGNHKLIAKVPPKGELALLLYDLENDPEERHDLLARDVDQADAMLEQLRARLEEFGVSSPAGTLPRCPDCEINAAAAFLQRVMQDDPQKIELFKQKLREESEARLKALGYVED